MITCVPTTAQWDRCAYLLLIHTCKHTRICTAHWNSCGPSSVSSGGGRCKHYQVRHRWVYLLYVMYIMIIPEFWTCNAICIFMREWKKTKKKHKIFSRVIRKLQTRNLFCFCFAFVLFVCLLCSTFFISIFVSTLF